MSRKKKKDGVRNYSRYIIEHAKDNGKKCSDNVRGAKIYVASLKEMPKIYFRNPIRGLEQLIHLRTEADALRMKKADMIYIIAHRDINLELYNALLRISTSCIIVVFAPHNFHNLRRLATTYILSCKNQKMIHWFIKSAIEMIALPSLVGLDYADIRNIFLRNRKMDVKMYRGKYGDVSVASNMKKNYPRSDSFFLIYGSQKLNLDFINALGERMEKDSKYNIWAARIIDNQRDVKIALFAGVE